MTTKGSFFDLQTPKMQLYAYTKTYMREGERERGKVKGGGRKASIPVSALFQQPEQEIFTN